MTQAWGDLWFIYLHVMNVDEKPVLSACTYVLVLTLWLKIVLAIFFKKHQDKCGLLWGYHALLFLIDGTDCLSLFP